MGFVLAPKTLWRWPPNLVLWDRLRYVWGHFGYGSEWVWDGMNIVWIFCFIILYCFPIYVTPDIPHPAAAMCLKGFSTSPQNAGALTPQFSTFGQDAICSGALEGRVGMGGGCYEYCMNILFYNSLWFSYRFNSGSTVRRGCYVCTGCFYETS